MPLTFPLIEAIIRFGSHLSVGRKTRKTEAWDVVYHYQLDVSWENIEKRENIGFWCFRLVFSTVQEEVLLAAKIQRKVSLCEWVYNTSHWKCCTKTMVVGHPDNGNFIWITPKILKIKDSKPNITWISQMTSWLLTLRSATRPWRCSSLKAMSSMESRKKELWKKRISNQKSPFGKSRVVVYILESAKNFGSKPSHHYTIIQLCNQGSPSKIWKKDKPISQKISKMKLYFPEYHPQQYGHLLRTLFSLSPLSLNRRHPYF